MEKPLAQTSEEQKNMDAEPQAEAAPDVASTPETGAIGQEEIASLFDFMSQPEFAAPQEFGGQPEAAAPAQMEAVSEQPVEAPPAPEPVYVPEQPVEAPPAPEPAYQPEQPVEAPPAPEPAYQPEQPVEAPPAPEPAYQPEQPMEAPPAPEPVYQPEQPMEAPPVPEPVYQPEQQYVAPPASEPAYQPEQQYVAPPVSEPVYQPEQQYVAPPMQEPVYQPEQPYVAPPASEPVYQPEQPYVAPPAPESVYQPEQPYVAPPEPAPMYQPEQQYVVPPESAPMYQPEQQYAVPSEPAPTYQPEQQYVAPPQPVPLYQPEQQYAAPPEPAPLYQPEPPMEAQLVMEQPLQMEPPVAEAPKYKKGRMQLTDTMTNPLLQIEDLLDDESAMEQGFDPRAYGSSSPQDVDAAHEASDAEPSWFGFAEEGAAAEAPAGTAALGDGMADSVSHVKAPPKSKPKHVELSKADALPPLPKIRKNTGQELTLSSFFAFSGYLTPRAYFLRLALLEFIPCLVILFLSYILRMTWVASYSPQSETLLFGRFTWEHMVGLIFFLVIVTGFSFTSLMVRRLRDLGRSPYWSVPVLLLAIVGVPAINVLSGDANRMLGLISFLLMFGAQMYLILVRGTGGMLQGATITTKTFSAANRNGPLAYTIGKALMMGIYGLLLIIIYYYGQFFVKYYLHPFLEWLII